MTKKELLTIFRALSALETAYMVTIEHTGDTDGFGYWECVSQAQTILERELLEGSIK
jgi:hypothetical protein